MYFISFLHDNLREGDFFELKVFYYEPYKSPPYAIMLFVELGIYENHICELRSEKLYEGRSSQLYTQPLQLRKESLTKIQACKRIEPALDLCDTGTAFYQLS